MGRTGKKSEGHRRAEVLRRHEVFLLIRKGRAALRRGGFQAAEGYFRKVFSLDPVNRGALAGLGEVYLKQGDHLKACEALEQAMSLGPLSEHLLYSAANACRGARRREKALDYFLRLIEVNPSHVRGLTRLGEAYLERKDFDRAGEVLKRALELEPHNPFALRGLACVLRGKRDYRAAIAIYEQLLRLTPDDRRLLVRLGEAYAHVGDAKSAGRAFRLALDEDPENIYARKGLKKLT